MLDDLGLIEEDALFWVEAGRDVGGRDLANGCAQLRRVLPNRDGVQIDDAINAFVRFLHLDPIDHGTEIIAEMQAPGRLHT